MSRSIKEEVVEKIPKKTQNRKPKVKKEVVEDSTVNSSELNTPSTFSPAWQHPIMNPLYLNGFQTPPFSHHFYEGFMASPSFESPESSPSWYSPYSRPAERTPAKTRNPRLSKKQMEEKIRIVHEVYWRTFNEFMFYNYYSIQDPFNSPTGTEFSGEPYKPTHGHPSWFNN